MMRARGAKVTDVVILVVAADDGVMPQTREAIDHAKAAGVPIIVAVNKIDKPGANPEAVKRQLSDLGLMPEAWGGTTVFVEVSAKQKTNLELLLEMILLVTDIGELKANPKRSAVGTVLETKLDRGRGPVATVLVQDGTLNVGDNIIAGPVVGRVRALIDDRGRPAKRAGPSTPVEVLGLETLPSPGDSFQSVADPAKARQIAMFRQARAKEKALVAKGSRLTLETLQQQMAEGGVKDLPIIVKADVQGSAEVLASSLAKLSDDKVKVKIIHSARRRHQRVGRAAGHRQQRHHHRLQRAARSQRRRRRRAREGRHPPPLGHLHGDRGDREGDGRHARADLQGSAARLGRRCATPSRCRRPAPSPAAWCSDGRITRQGDAQVRLLRDNVVVWEGKLASLRRFKDDVSEVKAGFECGIGLQTTTTSRSATSSRCSRWSASPPQPSRRTAGADAMAVVLLTVDFHFPFAQSLKDKRMILRGLKDRAKKFNVSVAEVDHHDLWQRATLAVVAVATDGAHAESELQAVVNEIERHEPGLITRTESSTSLSGWGSGRADP